MTQQRSRATVAATVAVAAAATEISVRVAEIKRRPGIGNRVPRVPGKDNTPLDNPPLISKKQSAAGMKFSAACKVTRRLVRRSNFNGDFDASVPKYSSAPRNTEYGIPCSSDCPAVSADNFDEFSV